MNISYKMHHQAYRISLVTEVNKYTSFSPHLHESASNSNVEKSNPEGTEAAAAETTAAAKKMTNGKEREKKRLPPIPVFFFFLHMIFDTGLTKK